MNRPTFLFGVYPHTATAAATDSYSGTAAANVLTPNEDSYWRPANVTGDKSLTIRIGQTLADRLCILGEPLTGVKIDLRASTDNFSSSDVAILTDQVLTAEVNAATLAFDLVSYPDWRVVFKSGYMPSPLRIAHVLVGRSADLPYLEKDYDPANLAPSGDHLVSAAGMYLGSNLQRRMRKLSLDFGSVIDTEFAEIQPWAEAAAGRLEPFFFVPDRDGTECHFGWLEKPRFAAPSATGAMRDVSPVTMLTRAA
jgi:hypothetical protein